MQSTLKKTAPAIPTASPTLRDIDDPVQLAAFVRFARVDPRAAAGVLAHYLDLRCTHHEGSDLARTIDNWAYAPDDDSFDTMVWSAGPAQLLSASVRIALCAVIASARRSGF